MAQILKYIVFRPPLISSPPPTPRKPLLSPPAPYSPEAKLAVLYKFHCIIQTHEKFKITLFIRSKHNTQMFGVIPFKTTLRQQLNDA